MKNFSIYRFLLMALLSSAIITLFIKCTSTGSSRNSVSQADSSWYKNEQWLNGLKLKPDESINKAEFSRQYHSNKTWWDEALNFLKTHDLDSMAPGTYVVDSGNVTAMISRVATKNKEDVKWEAHRNFNDLQYIIKGKAEMGVAASASPNAVITMPYDPKTDNENFTVTGEKYYDAAPGTFFIFSPKEMHRPAFKMEGYDTIKKIVIKVRVPK